MPTATAAAMNDRRHADADERSSLLPTLNDHRVKDAGPSRWTRWTSVLKEHAWTPLPHFDSSDALPTSYVVPLLLQCVITGLADASTFSLTGTWVGFMTGNMVQMVINAFDFWLPSSSNASNDQDRVRTKLMYNLSAIGGFMLGCQVTALILKRFTSERSKRMALVAFSLYRSVMTFGLVMFGAQHSTLQLQGPLGWLVHSILAASMGCQSTYSTSLATPFSNTVVFTATLTAVSSDLHLHNLRLEKAKRFKLLSIVGLLSGGALSQAVLKLATKASRRSKHEAVQHALMLLSAMELLLGLSWFLCGIAASSKQYARRRAAHLSSS